MTTRLELAISTNNVGTLQRNRCRHEFRAALQCRKYSRSYAPRASRCVYSPDRRVATTAASYGHRVSNETGPKKIRMRCSEEQLAARITLPTSTSNFIMHVLH